MLARNITIMPLVKAMFLPFLKREHLETMILTRKVTGMNDFSPREPQDISASELLN